MTKLRIASFLLLLFIMAGCGTKKSDMIVGNWKFENATFDEPDKNTPAELKSQLDQQMNAMKEDMRKTYTWKFNADGSYTASYGGSEYKGKWKLSPDEKVLFTAADAGSRADTCLLLELNQKSLIISQKDHEGRASKTTFARK